MEPNLTIEDLVCDYFNVPKEMIEVKTRKREVVQARQVCHFFYKSFTDKSLASIGALVGSKDHATVLHSVKTVNNLIDTDVRFRKQIEELTPMAENIVKNEAPKLRIGTLVWVLENDIPIKAKIVSYSPKNMEYTCIHKSNNSYLKTYVRTVNNVFLVNPVKRYDLLYLDDINEASFAITKIMNESFTLVIKWNLFTIDSVLELANRYHLDIFDLNGLVWNDRKTNQSYAILTNNNPELNNIRNLVVSKTSNSLFGRIKQLVKGRYASVGKNFIAGYDKIDYINNQIEINYECQEKTNNLFKAS